MDSNRSLSSPPVRVLTPEELETWRKTQSPSTPEEIAEDEAALAEFHAMPDPVRPRMTLGDCNTIAEVNQWWEQADEYERRVLKREFENARRRVAPWWKLPLFGLAAWCLGVWLSVASGTSDSLSTLCFMAAGLSMLPLLNSAIMAYVHLTSWMPGFLEKLVGIPLLLFTLFALLFGPAWLGGRVIRMLNPKVQFERSSDPDRAPEY